MAGSERDERVGLPVEIDARDRPRRAGSGSGVESKRQCVVGEGVREEVDRGDQATMAGELLIDRARADWVAVTIEPGHRALDGHEASSRDGIASGAVVAQAERESRGRDRESSSGIRGSVLAAETVGERAKRLSSSNYVVCSCCR